MAAVLNKNLEQSVGSLKGDLSTDTTFDPPKISLDSPFKRSENDKENKCEDHEDVQSKYISIRTCQYLHERYRPPRVTTR
jgi:hypothetical protein